MATRVLAPVLTLIFWRLRELLTGATRREYGNEPPEILLDPATLIPYESHQSDCVSDLRECCGDGDDPP